MSKKKTPEEIGHDPYGAVRAYFENNRNKPAPNWTGYYDVEKIMKLADNENLDRRAVGFWVSGYLSKVGEDTDV